MYHHVDEVEWHLTAHPIHGEWNVRELREQYPRPGSV